MLLRYVALPTDKVRALQRGGPDAYGMVPEKRISDGDGVPCRHCLQNDVVQRSQVAAFEFGLTRNILFDLVLYVHAQYKIKDCLLWAWHRENRSNLPALHPVIGNSSPFPQSCRSTSPHRDPPSKQT